MQSVLFFPPFLDSNIFSQDPLIHRVTSSPDADAALFLAMSEQQPVLGRLYNSNFIAFVFLIK